MGGMSELMPLTGGIGVLGTKNGSSWGWAIGMVVYGDKVKTHCNSWEKR